MKWRTLLLPFILLGVFAGCTTLGTRDRAVLEQQNVPAALYQKMLGQHPLTLAEIVELSRRKVPPAFIVRYVDNSLAEYQLTAEDVLQLRRAGVHDEVINYLLKTPSLRLRSDYDYDYDPFWRPLPYAPVIIHHHHHHRRK